MLGEIKWIKESFFLINLGFFISIAIFVFLILLKARLGRSSDFEFCSFKGFITEWGIAHQFQGTIEEWVETSFFWGPFLKMNYKIGKYLSKFGFSPNLVSSSGFLLSIISGWFIILSGFSWSLIPTLPIELLMLTNFKHRFVEIGLFLITAGVLYIFSGLVDGFDGAVARVSKRITKFGSIYDNVLDKYADLTIFLSIILAGLANPVITFLAMIGSYIVEYARAFAESRGINKTIPTLAERPVKLVYICVFFFVFAGHLISLDYYNYLPFSVLNFEMIEIGMIILVFFTQVSGPIMLIYLKKTAPKFEN